MIRVAIFAATAGYLGYFPVAPGTIGSLAGLGVYWVVMLFDSRLVELMTIVGLFGVGVWSGTVAERYFGGIDPGPVVLDEVVGMLITLAWVPAGWQVGLLGFFLFRLFDVIKPYPSARLERLPGGLGVMADDAMAAVYANLSLQALVWFVPAWTR